MHQLTSLQQFQDLLDQAEDFIIFKHSNRCSISDGACKEIFRVIEELQLDNIYMLDVLHTGDLKFQIADILQIKHESPQVIILQQGKVKYHASHTGISKAWLTQCLQGLHDTRVLS